MVDTRDTHNSVSSTSSRTSLGVMLEMPCAASRLAWIDGAASVTVPMRAKAAVEASIVADINEFRSVEHHHRHPDRGPCPCSAHRSGLLQR